MGRDTQIELNLPSTTHLQFPISQSEVPPWVGGRLKYFKHNREVITTDLWVRNLLSGYVLPFITRPPLSFPSHRHINLSVTQTQTLQEEISDLLQKQAIWRANPRSPGYYSQMFVVPKKDGGWRPIINLKDLNSYLQIPHFKLKSIQSLKGCSSSERLYGKSGFKGCLPHSLYASHSLQVPLMEREVLRVHLFLIWPCSSSTHFHQVTQTESVVFEESRSPSVGICRHLSCHGIIVEPFEGATCSYHQPFNESWIPAELQEACYGTGTNNEILRLCDQLNGNDVVSSRRQSVENQGVQPCTQLQGNNRETVGSSDRVPFSMHSCNPGGSTALQSPTAIKTSSSWTKGKQLRSLSSDITGSTTGSNVVGVQSVNQSLTSNPEASSLI